MPPPTLTAIIASIVTNPKTLTEARANLDDLKKNLSALATLTAAAKTAAQPAPATKPTAPTNPFLHYKSLQGAARADFFKKNQDQIWKAMEAMPANS